MEKKKIIRLCSLFFVAVAFSFFVLTVAKIIHNPSGSIYNFLHTSRSILVFCLLFIAYAAINRPKDIFRFDLLSSVSAAMLSALLVINLPIDQLYEANLLFEVSAVSVLTSQPLFYFVLFLFYCVFFYFLFISIKTFWFSVPLKTPAEKHKDELFLFISLLVFLGVFILLYLPVFPYRSSPDTLNQWQQIHGELSYNRIHAIGHTVFLKALLSIYDSYTIVIIFHIIAVIGVYMLFARYFLRHGIDPKLIIFVVSAGILISAKSSQAYFFPWKDTPAALCIALVTYFLLKYAEQKSIGSINSVFLGLALAGCFIFRLNGIIALIVCSSTFALSFLRRKLYRQLVLMLTGIAVSISVINIYTDKVLQPEHYENGFSVQVFASGIAAMVNSGELSPEELAEIDEIISVEWMQNEYRHPLFKQSLIWKKDNSPEILADKNLDIFSNKFVLDLGEHKADVIKLYLKFMPKHFGVCVQDVLGSLYAMWHLRPLFIYSYIFPLVLVLYLAIKAKLQIKDLLIFLPSACNTISIMISTITNEERYFLPSFMLMPVFFMFILLKNRERGIHM